MKIRMKVQGLLLWVALYAFIGTAAPMSVEDKKLNNALTGHIEFLADDLLEGRGTGSEGYDLAARYVAAQFRQLGLTPGGNSNSWFQPVPLLESKRMEESARFELHVGGETNVLEYNLDYLAYPNFIEPNVTITAPLVFAGFGVQSPELNYDDFVGIDLKGKIAVVLSKAPPRFPATALAHHSSVREKLKKLVNHGAIGVITIPMPKDMEEFPWPSRINQSRFSGMRWVAQDGTPVDVLPQSKVSIFVSPRGSGKVFARAPKTLQETLARAAASEPQNFPLNMEATISIRSEQRKLSSANVLGVLPGSDKKLMDQAVVLTAHLDHQGRGPAINGDAIYNGAYDNAIGTAMLLEIARILSQESQALKRTFVFAAVTAEEKGLIGSDYLAQNWPLSAKPVANLNLDMVMVSTPTRSFTILGVEHSSLRIPVEAAAKRLGLALHPDPEPERVVFIRSDQYSFIRQGVPAIFPKVYNLKNSEPAPEFITPEQFVKSHYHKPSDDLSLPRDAESSVRFVRFMADVARQVAQAEDAPQWNQGDFFGETFANKPEKNR